MRKNNSNNTYIANSRLGDSLGNNNDDEYLVINKDQDMIDKKSYKGNDTFGSRPGGDGYQGIDYVE